MKIVLGYWCRWWVEFLGTLLRRRTTLRQGDRVKSFRHGFCRIAGPATMWGYVPVIVENVPGLILVMALDDLELVPWPDAQHSLVIPVAMVLQIFSTGTEWRSHNGTAWRVWSGVPDDAHGLGIRFDQERNMIHIFFDSKQIADGETPVLDFRPMIDMSKEASRN